MYRSKKEGKEAMRLIVRKGEGVNEDKLKKMNEFLAKQKTNSLISLEKIDSDHSQMMKYYRASVINDIADFLGESNPEEAHRIVLEEFSPTIIIGEYEVRLTTRAFDKSMWLAFLKAVTTEYLMRGANITPAKLAGYEYEEAYRGDIKIKKQR
jgi:hypothetical protein